MANMEHLEILRQGVKVWNQWRDKNPTMGADLVGADLQRVDLCEANLRGAKLQYSNLYRAYLRKIALGGADLSGANLGRTHMRRADLSGANLVEANLSGANLSRANLRGSILIGSNLRRANLSKANLVSAELNGADLSRANLVETILDNANLTGCHVYGVSVWNTGIAETIQKDLVITQANEPAVTVDDLEVAQFIYLMLNNEKIRRVIDTVTSKAILILGSFSGERKKVLNAIKNELRQRNYLPILFDFEGPSSKDTTSTVETLARMARFVIADVTDPSSIPHELATVVPFLRTTPVRLLRLRGATGYSMVQDLSAYPWVLDIYEYEDTPRLLASLTEAVIEPAERKVEELRP